MARTHQSSRLPRRYRFYITPSFPENIRTTLNTSVVMDSLGPAEKKLFGELRQDEANHLAKVLAEKMTERAKAGVTGIDSGRIFTEELIKKAIKIYMKEQKAEEKKKQEIEETGEKWETGEEWEKGENWEKKKSWEKKENWKKREKWEKEKGEKEKEKKKDNGREEKEQREKEKKRE